MANQLVDRKDNDNVSYQLASSAGSRSKAIPK